eukprot:scaffold202796_cov27-Tisochrysis_lutea.AAC.1
MAASIHTRIDRIYHSKDSDAFQWQRHGPSPDLFSGKAASDHLPVLAKFEIPGYKPGRHFDEPIDLGIIHEKGAMKTVELLLQRATRKMDEGEDPESIWEDTKGHIATFLREETKERRRPSIQSALELQAARLNIRLAQQGPNAKISLEIARTQKELVEARSKIPIKDLPLHGQLRREELHSKEFFAQLKPRRWKANITELFRTRNWDRPEQSEHETANSDREIRRELRGYYVWLYSPKATQRVPEIETVLTERPLSDLDRRRLEGRIDVEETLRAIRGIGPGKSAGPDGIPAEVYKAHEKLSAPLLTRLYNLALDKGTLAYTMREGDIIL